MVFLHFFFKWPNDSFDLVCFPIRGHIFFFLNVSLWRESQRKNDGGLQWRCICGSSRSPPPPSPPPPTPPSSSPAPPPPPSAPSPPGVGGRRPPRPAAYLFGRSRRRRRGRRCCHVKPRATAALLPITGPGPGPWTSCSSPGSGTGCRSCHGEGAPSSALASPATAAGH